MCPSSLFHLLQSQPMLLISFSILGLYTLTKFSISLIYWSYAFFLRRPKDLGSCYGSWALVTGCTDGIGKAMAFELARKNLNLVLLGRNPDKLHKVSESIREKHDRIRIKNVVVDLSGDLGTGMRLVEEEIEGLDVGVVVNNAGVTTTYAEFFHEREMETWMDIVKVNLEATTAVTRVVLPGMLERNRGAVVNIGSGSGSGSGVAMPSFPLYDVYAGTKAYIDQFSKSLHVEYKNKGIDVQCQVPMYVETKMISEMFTVRWYSLFVASPSGYARAAVRWIGYGPRCVPYLPHFIQCWSARLLPDFILNYVILHFNLDQRRPT